ncbi:RNA ligase [Kingella negevensis]|uniref:RNA ligase n=1 Tax=Kingella negevensis TaxID=1522312 RepID=UPI0025519778|nr:RNA ligase [Kingella negevensis]MDK4680389.1 RNA ligase [Kingella negevensis]MDK4681889.1 RNA ligase [Kingella negevensis]MDK4690086.1 RNA ligase [Kingella negevensis]MDK4692568.1 RNA ligase [Kingella negevensis]MDK4698867.1 RNA ligase [Kingella negevensis]
MQKFILLRGHQGSGKSTFAAQKIAEFQRDYPNAQIIHIENDKELTDENGVYHFDPEKLAKAQQKGMATFKNALKQGQQSPHSDVLIVNSNTNQKANACRALLDLVKKHRFATEVYRLHNFYPNAHNVPEREVLSAYHRLNQNRVKDEQHVPAICPISAEQQAVIDEMNAFQRTPLDFDETQQTYVTKRFLQHGQRDFTAKASRQYPELRVLKYRRHVFYDNCFNDALVEMRGLVLDSHDNIIIRPFKKVFNYSERVAKNSKYPIEIPEDFRVDAVVKVNGFLGCCTHIRLPENHTNYGANFNNKTLFSTTGSLDSDFAKMTAKHCSQYENMFSDYPNHTFLFEVCDPIDVHIIREAFGATLIGVIEVATGRQWREQELDDIAARYDVKRPQVIENISFGELKALLKTVEHEGFMVFDSATKEMLFKLKSPYYLVSKLFGRSTADNLSRKLDKRHVDEEFYPLIDYISANQSYFNELAELDKIAFIQEFLRNVV